MKKYLRALTTTAVLAVVFPLLPTSSASANTAKSVRTTFEEAAHYTTAESRHSATGSSVTVDDEGNIYTSSTLWVEHNISKMHTRQIGVNENHVMGRGTQTGNILNVTKVNKDGELQWVWELRPVVKKTYGWWRDIAVAPDGKVHIVGWFRGKSHAYHHAAGDPHQPSEGPSGELISGDYIMDANATNLSGKSNGQLITIRPDGTTKSIRRMKSHGYSQINTVDVDDKGHLLLSGRYTGYTWFDITDHSNSSIHKEKCSKSCPWVSKIWENGSYAWHERFNHCGSSANQHSSAWDAKFLDDGRVVVVGGYDGNPTWRCENKVGGLKAAQNLGQTSPHVSVSNGSRAYMAFLSTETGHLLWARSIGSETQFSNAIDIVQHPTTGDLYIAGIWENNKKMPCATKDKWRFYPNKPSTGFQTGLQAPAKDKLLVPAQTEFTEPIKGADGLIPGFFNCSHHQWLASEARNSDMFLLHTDAIGNYKNVKLLAPFGYAREHLPRLAINSDGSEIGLGNTSFYEEHTVIDASKTSGAKGYVMTFNSSDLETNWKKKNTPWWDGDDTYKYHQSWVADVAYGPDDKLHATGRTVWSTFFGKTKDGTVVEQSKHGLNNSDPFVLRYTLDGFIDVGGSTAPPPAAPDGYGIITGEAIQDDDGTYLIGPGGEVIWNEPLCAGGRWEITPQPGIAIRQYMIAKSTLTAPINAANGSGGGANEPADVVKTFHSGPDGSIPNYNILWQDGYQLDADGGSADFPDLFKVLGWDDGITDLDAADDLPVGFYFRQNTIVYNTNSGPSDDPVYSPTTRVDGHTWDLDEYHVYLAFAHPGGAADLKVYPTFKQVCPDPAGFTLTKTTLFTDEDGAKDKFTFQLDSRPTAEVVFNITWTDPSEISVSHSDDVIKFNKDNWDGPGRRVTATGLPDGVPDGDITSYINVQIDHDASSYEYASLANKIVDVINENVDLLPPPPNPDLDGDGIDNEDEVDGCVLLADCDGDGINDPNEVPACILVSDCDGDGLPDNQELPECIQDPRCNTDNNNPVEDEKPEVTDPEPVKPENPPAPAPPDVSTPEEEDKPQDNVLPEVEDNPSLDSDGDGIPDNEEPPACVNDADCDGDGIPDGEDASPENDDADGDGVPDGSDPDPSNPDTDGDGIPDGEDEDSDGNGIPDEEEEGVPGIGLPPEEEVDTPANTPDDGEGDDTGDGTGDGGSSDSPEEETPQSPQATPGDTDSNGGLFKAIGDLPAAAIAAAALVAAVAAAGAAASLAGPGSLRWLFRGGIGVWLFGLLFGRRGVRCAICDVPLVKRDGIWVDKDTHWQTGINEHIHVPADFSDKDRVRYLNSLK